VFEVNEEGEIVWQVEVAFPYEAERLETGDESAGGESAAALGLESRRRPGADAAEAGKAERGVGLVTTLWLSVKRVVPGPILNGIVYVTPGWMGPTEAAALVVLCVGSIAWAAIEFRWANLRVQTNVPIRIYRRD
jgi:hypothetical protein